MEVKKLMTPSQAKSTAFFPLRKTESPPERAHKKGSLM